MKESKETLTASQLIPYLGTGLKVELMTDHMKRHEMRPALGELVGWHVSAIDREWLVESDGMQSRAHYSIDELTPIMRPFSDLTKEIEVKGERFVPIEKLGKIHLAFNPKKLAYGEYSDSQDESDIAINDGFWIMIIYEGYMIEIKSLDHRHTLPVPYLLYQKLIEWGFPVNLEPGTWKEAKSE